MFVLLNNLTCSSKLVEECRINLVLDKSSLPIPECTVPVQSVGQSQTIL